MSIPFIATYVIRHANGAVQPGRIEIMASRTQEARIVAREVIRNRCGETPLKLEVRPA